MVSSYWREVDRVGDLGLINFTESCLVNYEFDSPWNYS